LVVEADAGLVEREDGAAGEEADGEDEDIET